MMDKTQLDAYCERHGITPQARAVIDRVRASPPTRRVQSGSHNVACRFSSRKMGLVIQAESHTNELPAVVAWEHDDKTYEFYDQPPKIKLSYRNPKGKSVAHLATPDFFLLQEGFAGWVECKTEEWLQSRATGGSTLYIRNGDNGWRCPAGEEYAASVGLSFQVRSSSATHWIMSRNLGFLSDYLDERCPTPTPESIHRVWNAMAGRAWVVLKDLLGALPVEDADTVFKMIADQILSARLAEDLLTEPERAFVFRDKMAIEVYRRHLTSQAQATLPSLRTLTIAAGQSFQWDGHVWRIVNVGDRDIWFEDESKAISNLARTMFEQMLKEGVIIGLPDGATLERNEADEIFRRASPQDYDQAMVRYRCLFPKDFEEPAPKSSDRARRKWRSLYKRGQELYGSGLVGLIPKISQRGNRERRLDEAVLKIMDEVIDQHYAVVDGWSIPTCWGEVRNRCEARGLLAPSEVALRDQIKRRRQHDLIVARQGDKAAYGSSEFYWTVTGATPRHGERPFEIGHIDHTELDLQFRGSRNGEKLGKAWLSVMIDAWSRLILAWVILYDSPSYRSCMALIRECIKRHGRIPKTIVVDKGSDFKSIYFETLLARLECHKKTRPGSKPRFGSIIERFFGMTNQQFVHCLRGNNLALQKPRQMSKTHDPRELSVWTLPEFRLAFEDYLVKVYQETEHSALGMSPNEAMAIGLAQSGMRRHKWISDTRELTILCLPSTPKGTATIDPGRGVRIGYIYYKSPAFRNPKLAGKSVPVRYDPEDKSYAVVWLQDHWEFCTSEYAEIFRGHTEKEIKLITQEITAKHRRSGSRRAIKAELIAHYLSATYSKEKILQQQLRDQEARRQPLIKSAKPALPSTSTSLDDLEDALWADVEGITEEY